MKPNLISWGTLAAGAAILVAAAVASVTSDGPSAQAVSGVENGGLHAGHGADAPAGKRVNNTSIDPAGRELMDATRKNAEKFRDLGNALDRGYANIDVFVPGMGCHYLNEKLLDGTFDPNKPEILVYAESPGQRPVLVALEYAVPISESPDSAPEGFAGAYDVWDRNETFGLWLLHAWTVLPNPDGVFAPLNPLAPQQFAGCGLDD
jgi:hypothetical protein